MLNSSLRDDPTTGPADGLSRLSKAILVVYLVIMAILAIDVLATDGVGKSAVGPMAALIIGIVIVIRDWKPGRPN